MSVKFMLALNVAAAAMCGFSFYTNVRAGHVPIALVMALFVAMNVHFGYTNYKRLRGGR